MSITHFTSAPIIKQDESEECLHGMEMVWCSTCNKIDDSFLSRSYSYGWNDIETKQDIFDEITDLLGVARQQLSVGSSLPSDVFEEAARQVGVPSGSMPVICEYIVRKAGMNYLPFYDSRLTESGGGSTVTIDGVRAMKKALELLLP
jgi:hypothetical protein